MNTCLQEVWFAAMPGQQWMGSSSEGAHLQYGEPITI